MCTNWKRFTFGAIILATLSLFQFGCGGSDDGAPKAPASKSVNGVVSDPATGARLSNITLTVYAIGADGSVAATPLSMPISTKSDGQGNYVLNIPADYSGGIMVVATLPDGRKIRSVLPSVLKDQTVLPPVMVSLATEMMVEYIVQNKASSFTPTNIQLAILDLEPFFGQNFTQTPPPTTGSALTPLQQNLLVMIQAINSLLTSSPGTTIADLVKVNAGTGIMALGTEPALTKLKQAIATFSSNLISTGVLPGSYVPPTITPVPEPSLTDTTPPTAPTNLTATVTIRSTALSWGAATDSVGVTAYYIYRNEQFIASVASPTLTYADTGLIAATAYMYEVKARDAAGNVSTGITVNVTTNAILAYTISGRVTIDGAGLAGVLVTMTGLGSGIAITDTNGVYTFAGAIEGSYTLTPSLAGYAFSPKNMTIAVTTANLTGKDFTAMLDGSVNGGVVYPDGTVIGGVTYPPGTIIGGVTYPDGVVIGGVTYPTATVIGGVTYPTGTVIGGVTYPNGVVIGGVTYPPGTVVGGVAFPVGAVTTGVTYPSGTVIGGVIYPSGIVTGGVIYPSGTVIGEMAYPTGTVIGGVIYPSGSIIGTVAYPIGSIIGRVTYPPGTIIGGVIYPSGSATVTFDWVVTP